MQDNIKQIWRKEGLTKKFPVLDIAMFDSPHLFPLRRVSTNSEFLLHNFCFSQILTYELEKPIDTSIMGGQEIGTEKMWIIDEKKCGTEKIDENW